MGKRGGEVRRSSETKGSNEGVGSHYLFFCVRKDIHKKIYVLLCLYIYIYIRKIFRKGGENRRLRETFPGIIFW
jgi:hypothetical protein